jgi:hypothetical protein
VRPGEPQHSRSGCLQRLVLDGPGHGRAVERPPGEHASLIVVPRLDAEQLVEQLRVDHHRRQQVGGEAERIHTQPEIPGTDLAGVQGPGHPPGERFYVGVLGIAAKLLGELSDRRQPQVETGWLEDPDGHHLVHPAGVPHLGRIAPVQQELGPAGPVTTQRQRADGQVGHPPGQVERVTDRRAQHRAAGRELVRDGLTAINAVEVPPRAEHQPGQVHAGQPVRRPVLEDRGPRECQHRLRVVGRRRQGRRSGGIWPKLNRDVPQRDRCVRKPARRAQQRCSRHLSVRRVEPRRPGRQLVPVLAEILADGQPLARFHRGQRIAPWLFRSFCTLYALPYEAPLSVLLKIIC